MTTMESKCRELYGQGSQKDKDTVRFTEGLTVQIMCPHCGNRLITLDKHCRWCGTKLIWHLDLR